MKYRILVLVAAFFLTVGTLGWVSLARAQAQLDLKLYVSPAIIVAGEKVRIDWDAPNADYCQATGSWSGNKASTGYEWVKPALKKTSYSIQCFTDAGDNSQKYTAKIKVQKKKVKRSAVRPTITITLNKSTVSEGDTATVTWDAKNAILCRGEGEDEDWLGIKKTKSREIVLPGEAKTTYKISCWNKDGIATDASVLLTMTETAPEQTQENAAPTSSTDQPQTTIVTPFISLGKPVISMFTASKTTVSKGENVTFSWKATNASSCKFLSGISGLAGKTFGAIDTALGAPDTSGEVILQCMNKGQNTESYEVRSLNFVVDAPKSKTVTSEEKFQIRSVAVKDGSNSSEKNPNQRWFTVEATHPFSMIKIDLYKDSYSQGKTPSATHVSNWSGGMKSVTIRPDQLWDKPLWDLYHNTTYTYVVTATKEGTGEKETYQAEFMTGTQFEITLVDQKNVNAKGEKTEEERAFSVQTNYPFAKLEVKIYEAASPATVYTSWTVDASSNPMSSALSHPTAGTRKLKAYTHYTYRVSAWLPGEVDGARSAIQQGKFETGQVVVSKTNAELADAFDFGMEEWGLKMPGETVTLKWDAYGSSFCKYYGTDPASKGMFVVLNGTYKVTVESLGRAYYLTCDYPSGLSLTKQVLVQPQNDPYGISFGYVGLSQYVKRTEVDDLFLWGAVAKPTEMKACSIIDRATNDIVSFNPTSIEDGIWQFRPKVAPKSSRKYEFSCLTRAASIFQVSTPS